MYFLLGQDSVSMGPKELKVMEFSTTCQRSKTQFLCLFNLHGFLQPVNRGLDNELSSLVTVDNNGPHNGGAREDLDGKQIFKMYPQKLEFSL